MGVFFFFYLLFLFLTCILFLIYVGETIAELPEPLTFSSDEELNNKEDNVVLLKMINGDEKVEEPKPFMTFASKEEVRTYYRRFAK
jgi:hypothetical protein